MMPDHASTETILPVAGIRLGTACAGIKKAGHRDLVVIELSEQTTVAATFTRNAFCSAPVIVAKEHLAGSQPRFLLVNTGNANAGTGEQGLTDARACCEAVAAQGGCKAQQVLPFSTGVIGEALPVEKIKAGILQAMQSLHEQGWEEAAWGILTTDTIPKLCSYKLELQGKPVTITGMAKGSGMIRPDMATMLAYIATDAQIEQATLQACLQIAVDPSFNRITVDGDTSTNDACVLMATGESGISLTEGSEEITQFNSALTEVCTELAKAMVRDGEGASKLINIEVTEAISEQEALDVAYTVAHSPLVKTAFFAGDPNWGRILAAVGRAGMTELDISAIQIFLDDVCIVENGARSANYTEEAGQAVMDQAEIRVLIKLGRGCAATSVWTCDFSYDYVRINAEYRT